MSALYNNAKSICDFVKVPVIGVVKCNGYGLSVETAANAWKQAGVTMFAVSDPCEVLELRQSGFDDDILLLAPVADLPTLHQMIKNRVILTVTSIECAYFYSANALGTPLRIHVAVDTGMGRFGVKWNDTEQLKTIYDTENLVFEGIFSHFSKSFEKRYSLTKKQLSRFEYAVDSLILKGYRVGMRHIANSCAALRFPETRLDAVRVGSALTGAELCAQPPLVLERAYGFKARVIDIKYLHPGDKVGYASLCRIKRDTKTAIVAVGYNDGFGYIKFPDNLPLRNCLCFFLRMLKRCFDHPYAVYKGSVLPLVGRIGNQFTLFDSSGTEINTGDYVDIEVPLMFPHIRKILE